jgi:hypothetical protein
MRTRSALWTLLVFLIAACPAAAQSHEMASTRALGMGGAFVAVADDATATWWNPAGLATGGLFSAVVERGRVTEPAEPEDDRLARRSTITGFAASFPSLGVNYYRSRISEIRPISASTGSATATRQEEGGLGVVSLDVSQFGITAGQSLNDHVVVASTLKILRAGEVAGQASGGAGLLDRGDDLDVAHKTRVDVDAGVMATFNTLKLGVGARNLRAPEFTTGGRTFTLERQVRAGIANVSGRVGVLDGVTVAFDTDLTKATTAFGDRRRVAAGAELWFLRRHAGVRGGWTHNTLDGHETSLSAGVSVGLTTGTYVEVARVSGNDGAVRGWSGSLRVAY